MGVKWSVGIGAVTLLVITAAGLWIRRPAERATEAADDHALPSSAGAPPAPSVSVAASVAAMSQEERRAAYDFEVAELRARLDRLEAYLHRFPSALTDVDVPRR